MKIIGGMFRGRNFFMPTGIRPTQDKTRKAIFDIIGQDLKGVSFLDLFAGSGAVGLEAISRQAKRVIFVEKDGRCVNVINENLSVLNISCCENGASPFLVIQMDTFAAIKQLNKRNEKFDFIFLDPPYGTDLTKKTLKTLGAYDILHPNSFIIIQHDKREILPESEGRFLRVKEKKYGNSLLSIFRGR